MKKQTLIIPTIIALGAGIVSNTYADTATDFSITVNPSLSLSVSASSVELEITPSKAGAYDSGTLSVTASTNNTTGYTLTMAATSSALTSNTINPVTGTEPTIPSIAASQNGISAADFAATTSSDYLNHWGLAVGSGNFNAVPTTSQTIKTSNVNIIDDVTTLTMASKLDLLTVPGVYSTTLNFQMTANPLPDTLESAYAKAEKQKATIDGHDYYAMQDMSSTICADVDIPSELQVYDSRDNHIYTIGRLADERCWLLDNLALDLTNSTTLAALSDTNTNASSTALGYLRGTTSRDPSQDPDGNFATAGVANWTSDYSYSAPLINTSKENESNGTITNPNDTLVEAANWKYGIYYNYCAASAGSYCYGNGTTEGVSLDRQNTAIDAEFDICPAGWRMPTGGSVESDGGEYQNLYDQYENAADGQTLAFRKAFHATMQGMYYGSQASYQGGEGWYWSSTKQSDHYMYILYSYYTPMISAASTATHYYGHTVRCIAK